MTQPKVGQVLTIGALGLRRRVYSAKEVLQCLVRGGSPLNLAESVDTQLLPGLQALCVLKTEDLVPGNNPIGLFLILNSPQDTSLQLRGFIATDETANACMILNTPED